MSSGVAYTNRDFEMKYTIAQHGVTTANCLSTLYFWRNVETGCASLETWQPTPHSNCQFRLKVLYRAGYIDHIEQPTISSEGRKPYLHILTVKGARALAAHLGCEVRDLAWRQIKKDSSTLFLEHLRWINECRTAFTYAIQVSDRAAQLEQWIDDAQLRRTHSKLKIDNKPIVIPDGYFQLSTEHPEPTDYYQFLEVDRGTETGMSVVQERATWERKVRMYIEFFKSGLYEKQYNTSFGRVLTVTTSQKRLANLKAITEKAGGKSRFLFTTFDKMIPVVRDPTTATYHTVVTNPIWQKAGKEGTYHFWLD